MTHLASITNNHLALECACGHKAIVPVTKFIEKFGLEANVNGIIAKARCSVCKKKYRRQQNYIRRELWFCIRGYKL